MPYYQTIATVAASREAAVRIAKIIVQVVVRQSVTVTTAEAESQVTQTDGTQTGSELQVIQSYLSSHLLLLFLAIRSDNTAVR